MSEGCWSTTEKKGERVKKIGVKLIVIHMQSTGLFQGEDFFLIIEELNRVRRHAYSMVDFIS